MIGETISHYKILEKLGEGGMGVVYKAQDTKLDRKVALKFLPEQISINESEKKRFIHEAKAAAALDHTNICAVYEIDETEDGQMFIAMACYEGETLKQKVEKGPLKLDEAINIAIQVAQGLQRAHESNIIHRDIKSANIIVTKRNDVKILDFGLAKLKGKTKLTKEGTTLGTIDYMSPEQAEGSKVDHRSDIWSLGVVLYEMVTGQLPFKGDYEQAIMYSIMNEQPVPITGLRSGIPLELEQVNSKTLAKEQGERYQHIDELITDLKRVRKQIEKLDESILPRKIEDTKARKNRKKWIIPITLIPIIILIFFLIQNFFLIQPKKSIDSIAVLPLENLSGDPEQEYFADGVTDAIIGELARIKSLKVISRTSIMQYKKVRKSLLEIGKELNVESIVEGTIMHSKDRVLIRVQLIEAATDHHLWTNDFESEIKDILQLQQEIAQKIVREIRVTQTPQEQALLSFADKVDPRANDLYLKAIHHYSKWTISDHKQAKLYLEKAIEIDPLFARPYAALAKYHTDSHFTQGLLPKKVFPKAKVLAEKAIKIDETLGIAHMDLAIALFFYDWDWEGAEKEFERALELQPGSSQIHEWYGFALAYLGRFDEAIYQLRRSIDLNPLYLNGWCTLVDVLITARRFDKAIEIGLRAVRLAPDNPFPHWRLGSAYLAKGMYTKSIELLEKAVMISGGDPLYNQTLACAYAITGQRKKALNILNEVSKPPVYIAGIYVYLGEHDMAFENLEIAFDQRDADILSIKEYFWWDPLRNDSRFQELLHRINFPD